MDDNQDIEISRAMEGDLNAQRQLFEAYYSYVLSISLRYMATREVAEEVLNDIFLKIFNRLYALDFLFQAKIAANKGTSSIFDAHHDGNHVYALKNRWSTLLYCTLGFHDKSLMLKAG